MENHNIHIGEQDGLVIIKFDAMRDYLVLNPEESRRLAEHLARHSYKAKFGIEPAKHGSHIVRETRDRLVTRATHIIRSLTEQKRLPGKIAVEVIDAILSEL